MKNCVALLLLCVGLLLSLPGCFWQQGGGSDVVPVSGTQLGAQNGVVPRLSFRFVLPPERASGNVSGLILPLEIASPSVSVSITLLNFGNFLQKTTVLSKAAPVENGVATVTFENIPALTAVASLTINGGKKGGYSEFQGAVDLRADLETVMDIAPRGSKLLPDITANIVASLSQSPTLFPKLSWGIAARIASSTFGIDTLLDTVYQKVLDRIRFGLEAPPVATVTITLRKPTNAPNVSVRSVDGRILAEAVPTSTVTGAVVKLTLSDGSVITLTDNGNGQYTGTVSNLAGASGFYIEAHKGDLEIQNLITDLAGTDLQNITCDHLTTAFTQVAAAFAKNSSTLSVATPEDLVKRVTQVSIEFNELRKEILDETTEKYNLTRKMFQAALSGANETTNTASSVIDLLKAGTLKPVVGTETLTWTDVVEKPIETGSLAIPVARDVTDDERIASACAIFFYTILDHEKGLTITDAQIASFSDVLADSYLADGANKINQILGLRQPREGSDLPITGFEGTLEHRKVDDLTYRVAPVGTILREGGAPETISGFEDGFTPNADFTVFQGASLSPDNFFPLSIRKFADGKWRFLGTRIKIKELNFNLVFRRNKQPTGDVFTTGFDVDVRHTDAYPVEKVELTGKNIAGIATLTNDPALADSDTWTFFALNLQNKVRCHYPGPDGWPLGSVTHTNGDQYKIKVYFKDGTTQTFDLVLSHIPEGFGAMDGQMTVGSGKINLSWQKWAGDPVLFRKYYIHVGGTNELGDQRVLQSEIRNIDTLSAEAALRSTSYTLNPGSNIWINVNTELKYGLRSTVDRGVTLTDQMF